MNPLLLACLLTAGGVVTTRSEDQLPIPSSPITTSNLVAGATQAHAPSSNATRPHLPPLPEGVVDLRFGEFFHMPVGPRGLEFTDRMLGLEGKRVRILGYMIRQTDPGPHRFLFAPLPVAMHEHEYGLADELPASTLHVFTGTNTPPLVPFTPGPLMLTGTLSLGNRQEPSGRVSMVRLNLDPPTDQQRAAMAEAVELEKARRPKRNPDLQAGHAH